MRVTLVVNKPDEGSETFLQSFAGHLAAAGHTVTVHALLAGRNGAPVAPVPAPEDGAGVKQSRALPGLGSPRFVPRAARLAMARPGAAAIAVQRARARFGSTVRAGRAAALAGPILATDPDVVHLAFSGLGTELADALDLLDGVKVVVSCRGSGELVQPVLRADHGERLRRLFARADLVHAVSDAVAAAARHWGAPAERVVVIRPAVDTGRFAPRGPRPPIGEPVRLVAVGRLHWVKGIGDLIDAVARLRAGGTAVALTVIGDGPERDGLRYRVHALGLAGVVDLVGAIDHQRVVDLVAGSDILVSSSLSEGISNAVLEAMALELPVVCTAVGGMEEVIDDGVDGLVVPPGRPDLLADAVARLAADPSWAETLGRAARRRVVAELTADAQGRAIAELYRRLEP